MSSPAPLDPLPSREHLLRQVALRAVTSPVSLFLGASGVLLTLSPAAWPLGLAALAADAAWLWWRIRDPEQARASSDEMLRQRWLALVRRLEAVSAGLDRETAGALAAIVESQERMLAMSGAERTLLPATRMEMISLIQHCLSLAEKRRLLHEYLASARSTEAQRQAAQLEARMEQAHDPVTRNLYLQALEQKRQELENYVRVSEAVSRIDGQLAAVHCTFDNLVSQVVRLHTADTLTPDPAADPLFSELTRLSQGVAGLEASINEVLLLRGAA